jgi:hypothetical protein
LDGLAFALQPCPLLEVLALAVVEEELVLDLHALLHDDGQGEVVHGAALE